MKFLASLFSEQTLDKNGELIEPDGSEFNAAIAAIERAAAERASKMPERRSGTADRRQNAPDARPPGAPERRSGFDRRTPSQQKFGRRGT